MTGSTRGGKYPGKVGSGSAAILDQLDRSVTRLSSTGGCPRRSDTLPTPGGICPPARHALGARAQRAIDPHAHSAMRQDCRMRQRFRSTSRVLAATAVALAALATMVGATTTERPVNAAGIDFGVADSMEQLRADAVVDGRPTSVSLTATRNESESFQLLINGPLTDVNVDGDLFGWGTTTAYRLADYMVNEPSDREGGSGAWRDALIPGVDVMYGEVRNAFPIDVATKTTLAVWIDVHVPPGTPGGIYNSGLQITANEGSATVPVSLEVLAIDLPSTSTLRSAFYMTYSGGNDDPVCIGHTASPNLQRGRCASCRALLALLQDRSRESDHAGERFRSAIRPVARSVPQHAMGSRLRSTRHRGDVHRAGRRVISLGWSAGDNCGRVLICRLPLPCDVRVPVEGGGR